MSKTYFLVGCHGIEIDGLKFQCGSDNESLNSRFATEKGKRCFPCMEVPIPEALYEYALSGSPYKAAQVADQINDAGLITPCPVTGAERYACSTMHQVYDPKKSFISGVDEILPEITMEKIPAKLRKQVTEFLKNKKH